MILSGCCFIPLKQNTDEQIGLRLGIALLLLAPSGSAQALGSLVGTVRDGSGAVIPGAAVAATQRETGITYDKQTNSAGEYVFDHLPVGTYTVVYSAPQFGELRFQGIQTHVASVIRQDATLQPASLGTSVQVQSSTPLVKTETAEIGQLVDSRQIEDLPLNGRDVFSLLRLTAGAETSSAIL